MCPRCCFKEIIPTSEVEISNSLSSLCRAHSLQFMLLEGQPSLNWLYTVENRNPPSKTKNSFVYSR